MLSGSGLVGVRGVRATLANQVASLRLPPPPPSSPPLPSLPPVPSSSQLQHPLVRGWHGAGAVGLVDSSQPRNLDAQLATDGAIGGAGTETDDPAPSEGVSDVERVDSEPASAGENGERDVQWGRSWDWAMVGPEPEQGAEPERDERAGDTITVALEAPPTHEDLVATVSRLAALDLSEASEEEVGLFRDQLLSVLQQVCWAGCVPASPAHAWCLCAGRDCPSFSMCTAQLCMFRSRP